MLWPRLRYRTGHNKLPPPTMAASLPNVAGPAAVEPGNVEAVAWPQERLALTDALWGEGFQFPGGGSETLRLTRHLGLSGASSVLLVGAGSGGPPQCVATEFGAWVIGFEAEPELVARAGQGNGRTGLGRRARTESWDPHSPDFGRGCFHHAIAFEPLRDGMPEPVLAAIAAALKQGGQFTLIETVADAPLDTADQEVAAWARLERRNPLTVPSQNAITRMLTRLQFEVRIAEDISMRHVQQALFSWRAVVAGLERVRPTAQEAKTLISEAELWLVQLRLFRARKLRRIRWHAVARSAR